MWIVMQRWLRSMGCTQWLSRTGLIWLRDKSQLCKSLRMFMSKGWEGNRMSINSCILRTSCLELNRSDADISWVSSLTLPGWVKNWYHADSVMLTTWKWQLGRRWCSTGWGGGSPSPNKLLPREELSNWIKITKSSIEHSTKTKGQSKVRIKILGSSNNTKRIIKDRRQIHGYRVVEREVGERQQQRRYGEILDLPWLPLFLCLSRVPRIQFLFLCFCDLCYMHASNSTIRVILHAHKTSIAKTKKITVNLTNKKSFAEWYT